ncbi:right-handed parallel beta-helix repeat-containing protein [Pseudoduganella buxea]|uniref:Right handed beta helix domain-containing protein n=1 Tax=Pseudoduganella buxea TaxID=1949069 RepID=A0A6I3SWE5_9BURK|nr:right-handed parallel beta-helix repeat-containing protein [Pseudoduganella buxea]MTV52856.1 hypothetical protein [Pseudoduganella buxea]GGC02484.1 hypothetical protein GCM10011572_25520 [Pseudoduganella buxea]
MDISRSIISGLATLAALGMAAFSPGAGAVDGVVLITQARALAGGVTPADLPGFPVTISEPGSYRLASDLRVATPNIPAVDLRANYVELDLNGFTIFGPGKGFGTAAGIEGHPGGGTTGAAVIVKNGFVRDMGGHGISIDSGATIDHVSSSNNGVDGMILTTGARITNCEANDNGRHGFRILIGQIIHSHAGVNGASGIYIEYGSSLVSDNVLVFNREWGIFGNPAGLGGPSGYKGNVIASSGAGAAGGALVELGPNLCHGSTACP